MVDVAIYNGLVSRNLGTYTPADQERIRDGRVGVVGLGCVGGMDSYILSRMGIGHLSLIDPDVNELSNVNRQPMATYDTVGLKKVEAGKRIIHSINPTVEVDTYPVKITESNALSLIEGCDVLVQCTDSMSARIISVRAAKEAKIPIIIMTGQPPYRGFVSTILPDGPTYEDLFGLDFVVGQKFADNPELESKVNEIKYERAKYAAGRVRFSEWIEGFNSGELAWSVTPERAYVLSVLQCREIISLLIGESPKAIAPKAYIVDLDGLDEFGLSESLTALLAPKNGVSWDPRLF